MSAMYFVQSFSAGKRGSLQADSPLQARDTTHAKRIAERLALSKVLVVAFMREGNTTTEEYEDAKLIEAFGTVPEEVLEMPRV